MSINIKIEFWRIAHDFNNSWWVLPSCSRKNLIWIEVHLFKLDELVNHLQAANYPVLDVVLAQQEEIGDTFLENHHVGGVGILLA
jgi:hypothetical protein